MNQKTRRGLAIVVALMLLGAITPGQQFEPVPGPAWTHVGVRPGEMLTLVGAVAVGGTDGLRLFGSETGEAFTVPPGKALVLTDVMLSPQVFPTAGDFGLQIVASPGPFTTGLIVTSSSSDPSSFQVNLTTGMVFQAGSSVRAGLNAASAAPINITAFGYLVRR
jgi:hypothetical protein